MKVHKTGIPSKYKLVYLPCSVGRVSTSRGTGGHGFDPGPRHTSRKNGTSCSSLGTQTNGIELGLVDPMSG